MSYAVAVCTTEVQQQDYQDLPSHGAFAASSLMLETRGVQSLTLWSPLHETPYGDNYAESSRSIHMKA